MMFRMGSRVLVGRPVNQQAHGCIARASSIAVSSVARVPSSSQLKSRSHSELPHSLLPAHPAPSAVVSPHRSFQGLGLSDALTRNAVNHGIPGPNDIQQKAIPLLTQKQDLVLAAETGSGKTLAYLLPLITRILSKKPAVVPLVKAVKDVDVEAGFAEKRKPVTAAHLSPRLLILVPNRELSTQILRTLRFLTEGISLTITMLPPPPSVLQARLRHPDIVVTTPSAVKHAYSSPRALKEFLARTEAIVADEADWIVLDPVGLDLVRNAARIGKRKRMEEGREEIHFVFAGATMPPIKDGKSKTPRALLLKAIKGLQWLDSENLHSPPRGLVEEFVPLVEGEVSDSDAKPVPLSKEAEERLKCDALLALLLEHSRVLSDDPDSTDTKWLIFCNDAARAKTIHAAVSATQHLFLPTSTSDSPPSPSAEADDSARKPPLAFRCDIVYGSLDRDVKSCLVLDFVSAGTVEAGKGEGEAVNQRTFRILICTDMVARGLDFVDVSTVVQVDLAQDSATYLHRVGRTARANKAGRAITFVAPTDLQLVNRIRSAAPWSGER
ncbi:hypothetical protein HKX48_000542 [Thoreauomyces humboldtii]|nr:hypothetical protein HKX48_000542 [Thoreauomyces humboldtii]